MGTNYYHIKNVCEHCGRGDEQRHIGKSSAGWVFALHVIPEDGINSLEDWKREFATGRIVDEYDDALTPEAMLNIITEREWKARDHSAEFLRQNSAVAGPNGLLRCAIGRYCVGHGEGTWDLIPGEFS